MLIYVMLTFKCTYSLNGSAYLDMFDGICSVIHTHIIYIYVLGLSVNVGHPKKRLSHIYDINLYLFVGIE